MALSNKVRKIVLYFLPGDALNEALPILLTAYATVLSHLRSQAVSDSLIDLSDDEVEEFVYNNTNVNVRSVSNAVMWNCQDQSNGRSYYKTLYIVAFALMLIFNVLSVISALCRPEFWCRKCSSIVRTIVGGSLFNIGLTLLIFSFDTSPYSCYFGPKGTHYILPEQLVDLAFDQRIVRFIKAAPFFALGCFVGWLVTICLSIIYDCHKNDEYVNIFEDKEYDSDTDVTKAKEDDDTYYKIHCVTIRSNTCGPSDQLQHLISSGSSDQVSSRLSSRSPYQVSSRSPDQVFSRSPDQVSSRSPDQVSSRSPYQVSSRSPDQVFSRSPDQVSSRSPDQVSSRSPDQVSSGSPDQVSSRSPDQVSSGSPNQSPLQELQSTSRNPQGRGLENEPAAVKTTEL